MKRSDVFKRYIWISLLPLAFLLYSNSFNTFPILEEKHSVLAEADSAAYMIPIRDFHLDKKYGDEYNRINRGLPDVAQKHKIHHPLYVILAGALYDLLAFLYAFWGISSTQALYSVNALVTCVNIGLFSVLLRHFKPDDKRTPFVLLLYALSLSTWIYGSVPESWPLSATLVLLFLVLLYKTRLHYLLLSVFIGIAMLNNIFLASLFLFLFIEHILTDASLLNATGKTALSGAIALATWVLMLSLLALFDSSLSPGNYLKYTFWFKTSVAPPVQFFNIRHWEVAITNFLINSIVSNQSNPVVPKNAILLTFQESPAGIISTLVYLALMAVVAVNLTRRAWDAIVLKDRETLTARPFLQIVAYAVLWIFLIVIMDPAGGFMYSTLIVPMLLMLTHWFTDFNKRHQKVLFYAAVGVIAFNNVVQVMKFRTALGSLY